MSQKTTKRKESGAGGAAGAADGPAPQAAPAGPPPARLTAAAVVAGLEGLAIAAWGVTMFFGGSSDVLPGVLVLALAALPLLAAYGLRRARRWSRGPALIVQLVALPIAWNLVRGDGAGVVAAGAVLGVLALAGLVLLVHPATTDALGISRTAA
ncbi:hypothetical protein RVR_6861 [Actinacidiphila reveromycinica]|uniref:Integral membrane protein n=1 Tax=Actinacidiphila reveromycinica TaxID=659352 RepID=A0A7U3VQQ8_9ACTN|nr:hypothetical protein [Streptomyces sp. SN-593]BBA99999.1 hypothetical protein RVR_6861 [Streptomyces sp. SN-593]